MTTEVILQVRASEMSVRGPDSEGPVDGLVVAFETRESFEDAVEDLVRRFVPAGATVRLELGRPWAELRTLHDLPPVPGKDLAALVRGQLDRFFPPRTAAVVLGVSWIEDSEPRMARAGVADRLMIEQTIDAVARQRGLVTSVAILNLEHRPEIEVSEGPVARHRRRWLVRRAAVAASIAMAPWLFAASVHFADLALDQRSLGGEVESLEQVQDRIFSMEESVQELRAVVEALDRGSPEEAWVLQRLAHLAEALPDTLFLRTLRLESSGGPVGETSASDGLIDLAEALGLQDGSQ